jgi:hypothetical protein
MVEAHRQLELNHVAENERQQMAAMQQSICRMGGALRLELEPELNFIGLQFNVLLMASKRTVGVSNSCHLPTPVSPENLH